MEFTQISGYFLAILVGITLGLIGSGGSILSVPILVYIMGVSPVLATAYSLFTVGFTALVGGLQKAKASLVNFRKVMLFGIPTICAVFFTRRIIVPQIPEKILISDMTVYKSGFIMLVFAVVMLAASLLMLLPLKAENKKTTTSFKYLKIISYGLTIGLIAGFVGAGGGFLIIPTLIYLARIPMKTAVGTSLFIVAGQSLIGFLGDIGSEQNIDWPFLLGFTGFSVLGIFIGNALSKIIPGEKLKTGFGWFVLAMGVYILVKELV